MSNGVLILDDDDDVRDALVHLASFLSQRHCLGIRSVAEAKARRSEIMACELAILDINLGLDVPSGVDAYHWLREQGFAGRIVFLTGHARDQPLVQTATQLGDAEVYLKPIAAEELEVLVKEPR